jgi:hypothetical protein
LLVCSVVIHLCFAEPSRTPSVLLFEATVDEARDFAVDSAYARGWTVRAIGPDSAEFEQVLDEGDPGDPLVPRRMIQISAFFMDEPGGVRVLLRAHEVEVAMTREQWSTDVTNRYAQNLMNALGSLRSKWDQSRETVSGPPHVVDRADTRDPDMGSNHRGQTGTWAYYAERYAESRGCELTPAGALLEASAPDWEQHRIGCRDGRSMRVLCRHGDCTTSR